MPTGRPRARRRRTCCGSRQVNVVYAFICIYTYIHTCIYIYIYMYIYIHIYLHIYTYIHTYMYIYTWVRAHARLLGCASVCGRSAVPCRAIPGVAEQCNAGPCRAVLFAAMRGAQHCSAARRDARMGCAPQGSRAAPAPLRERRPHCGDAVPGQCRLHFQYPTCSSVPLLAFSVPYWHFQYPYGIFSALTGIPFPGILVPLLRLLLTRATIAAVEGLGTPWKYSEHRV